MNLSGYQCKVSKDFHRYEFYSEGPKGLIKKVVRFDHFEWVKNGPQCVNVSFGDWNEKKQVIEDLVVTNNGDADKILATVANCIWAFTRHCPDVLIYAEGSTPVRTRKYQMGINKYFSEISKFFDVYGYVDNIGFVPFVCTENYTAFLAKPRKH